MQNDPLDAPMHVSFFAFSGDAKMGFWTHRGPITNMGWSRYDEFLSHEPELVAQGLWEVVERFPTYQRFNDNGRPQADEHLVLYALLMKQFLGGSYRWIESQMRILWRARIIPGRLDESTFRKRNTTRRFTHLLGRFHRWILAKLPAREAIVATDATGYTSQKTRWRGTKHALRAADHWIKDHNAVEVPTMLYLSGQQTEGRVHDSKVFAQLWDDLPNNIKPVRSLADKAYSGQACAHVASSHGATPIHHVKDNAKWTRFPTTEYQKMVRFQRQFPNRSRALRAPRAGIEATYSTTKQRFTERLACRTPPARANEIQAKKIGHNVRRILQLNHVIPS
jgi:hypothetical protein